MLNSSIKTFVHFKFNIKMDLDFYVRVRTCKKRLTGKQLLLSLFKTYRLLKQYFGSSVDGQ